MAPKRELSFSSLVRMTHTVHLARGRWVDVSGSRRYPMPTPAPPLLASELLTMPDASCYERTRDSMLRGLQHKMWTYIAVVWLVVLCIDFLFYACTLLGLHTITPESKAQWWNNAAVKLLSALFTYVCVVALPWRVANLVHLFSARSERGKPGVDFYGRETEDIWFHIPRGPRATLVLLLWGNAGIQIVHQTMHIVWNTYDTGAKLPAVALLPLTMVLSAGCGGIAAVYQWVLESRLHLSDPKRFKPGPIEAVKEVRKRLKEGEKLPSAVKGAVQKCSGKAETSSSGRSSKGNEKSGGAEKVALDQFKKSRVGVEPQAETATPALEA